MTMEPTNDLANTLLSFILEQYVLHQGSRTLTSCYPLIVGLQGPQGCGKTTVTKALQVRLCAEPNCLNTVVLSIDDFYLPHSALIDVAARHPDNPLLQGRGQPGTHDLDLAQEILQSMSEMNSSNRAPLELPVFDKSLHGGEGDRLGPGNGPIVQAPVEIVIIEGWCIGFYPLSIAQLRRRFEQLPPMDLGYAITFDAVSTLNDYLKDYVCQLYPYVKRLIQVG